MSGKKSTISVSSSICLALEDVKGILDIDSVTFINSTFLVVLDCIKTGVIVLMSC